jgi:2-amino-4-hydroxy-6-hydroxymethyldihydropteridine diphosphokinase
MFEVYIGLGSNLMNPEEQIRQARMAISKQADIVEIDFSSLYASSPMGPQDQPDYVNAVMRIKTGLSAIELLRVLQEIENNQGRARKGERWGPRSLDLDLLLYADQQVDIPDLIVPHTGLSERAFVLYPLQEIAPDNLFVPGRGALKQLIAQCPLDGLEKLV